MKYETSQHDQVKTNQGWSGATHSHGPVALNKLFPLNVLFLEEMTCRSLSVQPTELVLQSCELRWQSYASLHVLRWNPWPSFLSHPNPNNLIGKQPTL